jgi:hypothetical protein
VKVQNISEKSKDLDVKLEKKQLKLQGSRKLFFIILAVVLIIIFGIASVYFGPKAEAVIVLQTRNLDRSVDVTVFKDQKTTDLINVQGKLLELEKESTKNFGSTGKKNVGEKAKGTVTISNLYNYQSPVSLAKGTKISNDGKNFILENDIIVPIAKATAAIENNMPVLKTLPGTADVTVIAEQSGDGYNLSPRLFAVAGYSANKVSATSKTAFTGGTNKEIKVVAEEDLQKAEENLKIETLETAKIEIQNQANKENLKVLLTQISQEVVAQEANKKVGDEADNFDMKAKIRFFVLGFNEEDIKNSVVSGVEKEIKADEMLVNREKNEITYQVSESNIDDGQMKLKATFKGKISRKMDVIEIKKKIRNINSNDAKTFFSSLEGLESASLNVKPSFWPRTPMTIKRIDVKFDYVK